jgi:hypothetical protein
VLGMQVVKRIGQPEFPASDGARLDQRTTIDVDGGSRL